MRLMERLFGRAGSPDMGLLYRAIVAVARRRDWYAGGGVPDTIDGRFDMVALVLSLVLLRLERAGDAGRLPSARLTERFVEDMDGQLRETGFGDLGVGKQVGKVMGALGGRLGAYRDGTDDAALVRNLWRGAAPSAGELVRTQTMIAEVRDRLDAASFESILVGDIS